MPKFTKLAHAAPSASNNASDTPFQSNPVIKSNNPLTTTLQSNVTKKPVIVSNIPFIPFDNVSPKAFQSIFSINELKPSPIAFPKLFQLNVL